MTHIDYNTIVVFGLLLIIVYYVSGFRNTIYNLYKKSPKHYLNTVARLKALEFSPRAIISIDIDGRILSWNQGASVMFGYKESDVIDKPLTIIIPDKYKERHLTGMKRLKETGHSNILGKSVEMSAINRKGEEFPILITIWKWHEGPNIFYTGIIKDITQIKQQELEIKAKLDMFEKAEEINCSGSWSWDILNDVVVSSKGFQEIFGIEAKSVDSTYLLKRVYFEDLPRVEAAIKRAFEDNIGYDIEYKIVTTDGNLRKVRVIAETYFNDKNELINLTGTIQVL